GCLWGGQQQRGASRASYAAVCPTVIVTTIVTTERRLRNRTVVGDAETAWLLAWRLEVDLPERLEAPRVSMSRGALGIPDLAQILVVTVALDGERATCRTH